MFLAYQASLAEQFEHIQRTWLRSPDFPTPGAGSDPIEPFVTLTAGGYFFAPSIGALAHLADPSRPAVEYDEAEHGDGGASMSDAFEITIRMPTSVLEGALQSAAPRDGYSETSPDAANPYGGIEELLRRQNPYRGARRRSAGLVSGSGGEAVMIIGGPAADFDADDPIGPEDWTEELAAKRLEWKLDEQTYLVSKAIAIPYTYRAPQTNQRITGMLLIGFEGSGGH